MEDKRGHMLSIFTVAGRAGMICLTCGAHTTASKLGYLSDDCSEVRRRKSALSGKLREARSRFLRGLHPHPRHAGRVEASWRLLDVQEEAEDEPRRAGGEARSGSPRSSARGANSP